MTDGNSSGKSSGVRLSGSKSCGLHVEACRDPGCVCSCAVLFSFLNRGGILGEPYSAGSWWQGCWRRNPGDGTCVGRSSQVSHGGQRTACMGRRMKRPHPPSVWCSSFCLIQLLSLRSSSSRKLSLIVQSHLLLPSSGIFLSTTHTHLFPMEEADQKFCELLQVMMTAPLAFPVLPSLYRRGGGQSPLRPHVSGGVAPER